MPEVSGNISGRDPVRVDQTPLGDVQETEAYNPAVASAAIAHRTAVVSSDTEASIRALGIGAPNTANNPVLLDGQHSYIDVNVTLTLLNSATTGSFTPVPWFYDPGASGGQAAGWYAGAPLPAITYTQGAALNFQHQTIRVEAFEGYVFLGIHNVAANTQIDANAVLK